jgi:hypothetical protein
VTIEKVLTIPPVLRPAGATGIAGEDAGVHAAKIDMIIRADKITRMSFFIRKPPLFFKTAPIYQYRGTL